MALVQLFGPNLLTKEGVMPTETALAGKTSIGIYFSAHWCPPCRQFTPQLAGWYNGAFKAKGMEIVFVSSDKDQAAFTGYYGEQPWIALPFEKRDVKAELSKKYKVQGVPTLVILNSEGKTITTEGRTAVSKDPTGRNYPWTPKPFAEVLGDTFLQKGGLVGKEALAGKVLGIYFSAHWCPPCKQFTPILARLYKTCKEKGLPFEVIFCSGDRTEADFDGYREEMSEHGGDWLAIPYDGDGEQRREDLETLFKVQGIPMFVICDEEGRVINGNGRAAVSNDPTGDNFPWQPPAVGDLARPEGIDETPSICVFMEGASPEARSAIMAEVEEVAKMYIADAKETGEDTKYLFFAAKEASGAVPQIRRMASLDAPAVNPKKPALMKRNTCQSLTPDGMDALKGGPGIHMLLLDLMDRGAYYAFEGAEITAAAISEFIKAYEEKSLARQQLESSN